MKPRPAIYGNVLIFGGGSASGEGAGVARIGGLWAQPNLGFSYLLAARHVIETGERERRLNEVALPAAYLQRHALEVALKDAIDTAFMLQRDDAWLNALRQDPKARPAEPRRAPPVHPFDRLVDILRGALAAIGFGDVPAEVACIAERLRAVEVEEPTRFRYLTLLDGRPSLGDPFVLHVGETQDALEEVFEREFQFQGHDVEDENLATALAHHGLALEHEIQQIVPIDQR